MVRAMSMTILHYSIYIISRNQSLGNYVLAPKVSDCNSLVFYANSNIRKNAIKIYISFNGRLVRWNGVKICCIHGRIKNFCKDCDEKYICQHWGQKYHYRNCGGGGIFVHKKT